MSREPFRPRGEPQHRQHRSPGPAHDRQRRGNDRSRDGGGGGGRGPAPWRGPRGDGAAPAAASHGLSKAARQELATLLDRPTDEAQWTPAGGVLWLGEESWGDLRRGEADYSARADNIVVPPALVESHRLRSGHVIVGRASVGVGPSGRSYRLLRQVESVNGAAPVEHAAAIRVPFKELTCIDPMQRLRLAAGTKDISLRLLDLLTPIGKGQRALIVAPPRTGKTMLLQGIARAISQNHPEVHLIVLLVDERPEEATDWKRLIRGEVLSSTSDEMASSHVALAEVVLERARRLVEEGRDVAVLFDSLTRLGRAYNLETRSSGRTLSGGIDARTLEKPKAFFGAARKTEEAGSLTIIATALIETGSRMDEVIFEEFKGTGNMELVLSRRLADLRLYPAIDVHLSGTRKEEKLLTPEELRLSWNLRRVLQGLDTVDGMKLLQKKIADCERPEDLLALFKEPGGQ